MDCVIWRHPRACDAEGRCIGRTDLAVDPRKAKRLAHRIRRYARREAAARAVWTSHLRRSAAVGRWLARWGWKHHVDERLAEMDFGLWDGLGWQQVNPADIDAWCADFASHQPGGGEALIELWARCAAFLAMPQEGPRLVVGHGGWITVAVLLARGKEPPSQAGAWPAAVNHGARVELKDTK